MFLKAFLVFSCLVLYTTSRPLSEGNMRLKETDILLDVISKMNCSNKFVQEINLTRTNNLCTTYQDTFCQINKALNDSSCTEPHMGELRRVSDQIQGNATCTLPDNGVRTNMEEFLKNLQQYVSSFRTRCPKK